MTAANSIDLLDESADDRRRHKLYIVQQKLQALWTKIETEMETGSLGLTPDEIETLWQEYRTIEHNQEHSLLRTGRLRGEPI